MSVAKERSRLWGCVLYPDCAEHMQALEIIRREYTYVGILHDKDVDDDGVLKKPHYHLILKFGQARWNTALADDLNIPVNYFERIRSFDSSAKYLTHDNAPDKYQYDTSALEGPLVPAVMKLLADVDENIRVVNLVGLLSSIDRYVTVREFVSIACENGLFADMRRMGVLMLRMIDEHNAEFHSWEVDVNGHKVPGNLYPEKYS